MDLFYFIFIFVPVILYAECAPINKEDGMEYLQKYGYTNNKSMDIMSKNEIQDAIKKYQQTFSLPVTGKLDEMTSAQMDKPRCGMPDKFQSATAKYKWRKTDLTYKLLNSPYGKLSKTDALKAIAHAFDLWAEQIPFTMNFKEEGKVDIDINFLSQEQGAERGGVVAYAYYPEIGDISFHDVDWTVKSYKGVSFLNTAIHEIGHSLGLDHSNISNSIMYSYVLDYKPNIQLHDEDKRRIKELYGSKKCTPEKIDAVLSPKEDTMFLISGNKCWKYINNKLVNGYPKNTNTEWNEIPTKVDAAFTHKNTNYFVEGNDILESNNNQMTKMNLNYKFDRKIDSTMTVEDRLYVYSGTHYWRFDFLADKWQIKAGFPKLISSFWKDVPSDLDSVHYDGNRYIYFLKGTNVYKFDSNVKHAMDSVTKIDKWLKC